MKHKCASTVLILALAAPLPAAADGMDSMFGLMFRMMLTMMNVMSGAMLGNNNSIGNNNWGNNFSNGFGGMNAFNMGMTAWPMMSGFGSPWNSFGGSPWNTMGSPWSSPWNSFGGSPWSSPWNSGRGNPFGGGYAPGVYGPGPGGSGGYPANYGAYPPPAAYDNISLLDGRWYGTSGEILEVRGNRFRLSAAGITLDGAIDISNDIVSLYSQQTDTVTRYTFVRNQTGLILQGINGEILRFTQNPVNGVVHVF